MTTTVTTTPIPSAAYTASGTADIGTIPGEQTELLVYIDATAVTGTTPSMTVIYQSSPDNVTFWDNTAGTAITAAGKQLIKVPSTTGKYGRLSYVITGTTPSFTFSAQVEAKRP